MADLFGMLRAAWATPGVSEFLAAALGGLMTMAAQWKALQHDREKGDGRRRDQQKATAWSIFFKIKESYEALTAAAMDLREARVAADAEGIRLWQVFQTPVHDLSPVNWTSEELVLLIDHKHLDLMQRYQNATLWLSNLVQSLHLYREMRVEFLSTTPSEMKGTSGTIAVDAKSHPVLMPRIAHLASLSESLEKVVYAQQPDAKQLLLDYTAAMKGMIGSSPELELD